jgi:prolipoprotein diacylglyceryltransferase
MAESSPASQQTTLVDCRCGLHHRHQTECVEFKSFTVLWESHKALSQSPLLALSIPRNPTLPNMLLHSTNDTHLAMLIGTTLRQFQAQNVESLCGIYFLVYRLLRVCLPSLRTSTQCSIIAKMLNHLP